MSQTSYGDPAVAFAGQVATTSMVNDRDSFVATEAIAFGRFVVHDVAGSDMACKLPAAPTDVTDLGLGFARLDAAKEADPAGIAIGEMVGVLRSGVITVESTEAVDLRDPVFVVDSGADAGKVSGATGTALPGAVFDQSISAPGLVRVRFNS